MPEEKTRVLNSEILLDTESICVDIDRYNELVRAESNMKIIENMYHSEASCYDKETFLSFIFGKKGDKKDDEQI